MIILVNVGLLYVSYAKGGKENINKIQQNKQRKLQNQNQSQIIKPIITIHKQIITINIKNAKDLSTRENVSGRIIVAGNRNKMLNNLLILYAEQLNVLNVTQLNH